jgi:hypothetical protein
LLARSTVAVVDSIPVRSRKKKRRRSRRRRGEELRRAFIILFRETTAIPDRLGQISLFALLGLG